MRRDLARAHPVVYSPAPTMSALTGILASVRGDGARGGLGGLKARVRRRGGVRAHVPLFGGGLLRPFCADP